MTIDASFEYPAGTVEIRRRFDVEMSSDYVLGYVPLTWHAQFTVLKATVLQNSSQNSEIL